MVSKRYANPNYELTPLRRVIHKAQYGISLPATEEPIGLPMIRMNNLQNDGWDFTDLKYIELSEEEAELHRVNPGNILFNRTNSKELVGKCEVFREAGDWVFASYLIRVVLDQTKAIPEFVSNFLNAKAGRIQIDRVSRQIIGMSNVNAEELQDLLIPLPSVEVQRSLVAEIEAVRQTRKQKLAQADELLSNLDGCFIEILGLAHSPQAASARVRCFALKRAKIEPRLDCQFYFAEHYALAENLEKAGFPVFKIGSSKISQNVVDGPFGSQLKVEEYQESGIPLIRVSNCRSGKIFDDGELVYISEEKHQQLIRSEVLPGDVLLTKAGHILGYAAVFPEDLERGNITSHLASIRPAEHIFPEFLAAYLRSYWGNTQIYRWGNKATRPELNTDEVRQLLVPLPPKDIQRSLVLEIEKRRADAQRLRQEAETEWEAAKTRFEQKLLGEES